MSAPWITLTIDGPSRALLVLTALPDGVVIGGSGSQSEAKIFVPHETLPILIAVLRHVAKSEPGDPS